MPTKTPATKMAYIRQFCLAGESIHHETAKLVASLSDDLVEIRSTSKLKPKPVRLPSR